MSEKHVYTQYKLTKKPELSTFDRGMAALSKLLHVSVLSQLDLVELSEKGIQISQFQSLLDQGFNKNELKWVIQPRTLSHRESKNERLTKDESDKFLRIAKITTLAEEVFDNVEKAMRWLHKPKQSLRGKTPLETVRSEVGGRIVEEMLLKIDSGHFT